MRSCSTCGASVLVGSPDACPFCATEPSRRPALGQEHIARSIWPTGKPPVDQYAAVVGDIRALARGRGIAEGRRLAAARMRRFACWLRTGREKLERRTKPLIVEVSPEAFMWWLAERSGVEALPRAWIADVFLLAGRALGWSLDDGESTSAVAELLASPEWAALSWQREAP